MKWKCPTNVLEEMSRRNYVTQVLQCDQCKNSKNCEVYAGTKKVSSGRVATSRGTYQVGTKTSKTEKCKQSLEKIKKCALSDKAKGVAAELQSSTTKRRSSN